MEGARFIEAPLSLCSGIRGGVGSRNKLYVCMYDEEFSNHFDAHATNHSVLIGLLHWKIKIKPSPLLLSPSEPRYRSHPA